MLFTFKYFNYLLSDVKSGDIIVSVNWFISLFFYCGISSIVNIVFSSVSVVCFVFVMYCILIITIIKENKEKKKLSYR